MEGLTTWSSDYRMNDLGEGRRQLEFSIERLLDGPEHLMRAKVVRGLTPDELVIGLAAGRAAYKTVDEMEQGLRAWAPTIPFQSKTSGCQSLRQGRAFTPGCDLHDPGVFETYFRRLWQDCKVDARGIRDLRESMDYPRVAEEFAMIRDNSRPVVVCYGDPGPAPIIEAAAFQGRLSKTQWQRLQSYTVNLYEREFNRLSKEGFVRQVIDGLHVWTGVYNRQCGLSEELADPADLIA